MLGCATNHDSLLLATLLKHTIKRPISLLPHNFRKWKVLQYWKYKIGITLEQIFSLEHRSASSVWSWQLCVSLWFVFCLTWAALVRLSLTGTVINLATLYFTKKLPSDLLKLSQIFQMSVSYKFCSKIVGFYLKSHFQLAKWKKNKQEKFPTNVVIVLTCILLSYKLCKHIGLVRDFFRDGWCISTFF